MFFGWNCTNTQRRFLRNQRQKGYQKSVQKETACSSKSSKITLGETGTEDIAGPKALQDVSRGVVHFAACQKAPEITETMVYLRGHGGLGEVGLQSLLLLLLHPSFSFKNLINLLYFLLKLDILFVCLFVCLKGFGNYLGNSLQRSKFPAQL